jgi:hypothetical protein
MSIPLQSSDFRNILGSLSGLYSQKTFNRYVKISGVENTPIRTILAKPIAFFWPFERNTKSFK